MGEAGERVVAAWRANPTADVFELLADSALTQDVYDFVTGGAGDERNVARNRAAFKERLLVPGIPSDDGAVRTSTRIFGVEHAAPVLVAPMGGQRMVHEDAERATIEAAVRAGVGYISSTAASITVEDEASLEPEPWWFQLYCFTDRELTRGVLERAERAGCSAVCVTVDAPVLGLRLRDRRNGFHPVHRMPWANVAHANDPRLARVTWSYLEQIRLWTSLPLLVKGVVSATDASRCVDLGYDGVIASNHGGRQLQSAPGALDALPSIRQAVPAAMPVLMDGGVRDAEDVVMALALGATAVFIGRPVLWALAVGGASAAAAYLEDVCVGVQRTLTLMGVASAQGLTRSHVIDHVASTPPVFPI